MTMLITVLLCFSVGYFSPAFSDSTNSIDYVPCEEGWYYFRGKCYKAGGREPSERRTWTEALAECRSYGADLASIQSKEEQDFIVTYLQLNVTWWTWIGLNDRENEGVFKWTDGSAFNYSNWDPYNPSAIDYFGQQEDCVHMIFDPEPLGEWNDRFCGAKDAYVCEKNANPKESSPNPMYCSREEGGGLKYKDSCYHVVTEMKSWKEAESYCNYYYNGHLLTINDKMEDYFLELAIPDIRKEMWIGINIQDQMQQKWTSGWYVSYDGFNEEQTFTEGSCVARKGREEWVTASCLKPLPFICEVSKGSPVLKPSPVGAYCPAESGWRDLGGEYCYNIETTKSLSFSEASHDCERRGGHLLSLHSQEESDILQPFVIYKKWSIFLGLLKQEGSNDTFRWIDGSKLDYVNWNDNEPHDGEEKCVEIWIRNMKWNVVPCYNRYLGYICSTKKIMPDARLVYESVFNVSTAIIRYLSPEPQ